MDADNLIRMANRIGDFFTAMPERDQALHDIVEHMHKFWEPRMRAQFMAVLADPVHSEQISPIVREAMWLHGHSLG